MAKLVKNPPAMREKVTQSCPTLCDPMDCTGQNAGVGSLSLLQWIFPTQGSNPGLPRLRVDSLPAEPQGKPKNGVGSLSLLQWIFLTWELNRRLLHCRQILYCLSHQGSPRMEWVAYPFSRGSSQLRNRTGVSCTAGGFSTS